MIGTRRLRAPVIGLLIAVFAVFLVPTVASAATELKFHAHVTATSATSNGNCGPYVWDSPYATCYGRSENGNDGVAGAFAGEVRIDWCEVNQVQTCLPNVKRASVPAGFTRLMTVTRTSGTFTQLIGAVKMPNGPFVILGGAYDGQQLQPSNANEGAVAQRNSPLYLYVGHSGIVRAGHPEHGYVFGFRGYLNY
jgi:hypothetical protein